MFNPVAQETGLQWEGGHRSLLPAGSSCKSSDFHSPSIKFPGSLSMRDSILIPGSMDSLSSQYLGTKEKACELGKSPFWINDIDLCIHQQKIQSNIFIVFCTTYFNHISLPPAPIRYTPTSLHTTQLLVLKKKTTPICAAHVPLNMRPFTGV